MEPNQFAPKHYSNDRIPLYGFDDIVDCMFQYDKYIHSYDSQKDEGSRYP